MATSIRLDAETEQRLEALARATGRTKAWHLRQAIEAYLGDWEDYHIALSRLEQDKDEVEISEVRRLLGLED